MPERVGEFKLNNPPADAISSAKFGPNSSQFLLVSSWDATVRLYDVVSNTQRITYKHPKAVLDCSFSDAVHAFSGDLDGLLKMYDLNTSTEKPIGNHSAAIRCVHFNPTSGNLVTGSWDRSCKLWDPRNPSTVTSLPHPDKVLALDSTEYKLVVATHSRKVVIWDLRNTSAPEQKRESNLKHQTRCVRCFPNGLGFAQSSIEGRVAVEYFDPSGDSQKKKYAFKCHRIKEGNEERIYPVNALAFHRQHNTFASGGSDGLVNIWDAVNKKRLCQFHACPAGITYLDFSPDGRTLAIASSYMFENGEPEVTPPDNVFIRNISDAECKPK